jgi:hypothetical protein
MIRSARGRPSHNSASRGKRRFLVGGGTVTQDPGQQLLGLQQRQGPQNESAYALQASQEPLGGDQRPARALTRQQRAHLLLRPGIVQNDQDTPVLQQRPVQRSASLDITRDLLIRDTERAKQQPQRVTGSHRLLGHTKQIEEEHPTRKARPQHMGGPDGERGLPHAPRACDETHHAGTLRTLGIRQLAYPDQLRGAAGEVVNQPGQLTHTSRTRPVIPQPAIARQLNKLLASIPFQRKRIRQAVTVRC